MRGLDRPLTPEMRYDRVVNTAPRLYKGFKAGAVKTASPKNVTIYMWNINKTPIDQIGEIRYAATKPYKMRGKFFEAQPVSPVLGAVFDPARDLGEPSKAFSISLPGFASVLGIPWNMIGEDTYILVCPQSEDTVVPNWITAKNGYWITPEFLNEVRRRNMDYILMAMLSRR